jgi:tetratricopeptide (TPR) repeat protein
MKSIIFCLTLLLLQACISSDLPINEQPMYGGIKKPKILNKKDKDYKTLNQKSNSAATLGWAYLKKNDMKMAMKRFNQSWLLNANNAQAYWGFGIILGIEASKEDSIDKLNLSIKMLKKASVLAPSNPQVLASLAKGYIDRGCYDKFVLKKDSSYWDNAEKTCERALKINPKIGIVYFNWSTCLFYQEKYSEAWNKLQTAEELNYSVPPKFKKDLQEKLKSNKLMERNPTKKLGTKVKIH